MEYRVVVATFLGSLIRKGADLADDEPLPFAGMDEVSFAQTEMDELRLMSDHPHFLDLRRGNSTAQRLVDDVTFGSGPSARTLPAGAQLTLSQAAILRDDDGEEFYALFPATIRDGRPELLGGGHSVLLIPRPRELPGGGTHWPTLRCNGHYRPCGILDMDLAPEGIRYDPHQGGTACFSRGTLILTPDGPRPVETLRPGGLVRTRDHGAQRIRWVSVMELGVQGLAQRPHLRPIRIAAGALGDATPAEDLLVSPRQRVVVRSNVARNLFGLDEVLIAASHLLGLPGITQDEEAERVGYVHVLLDHHELVLANGAWTETFYTEIEAMTSLHPTERREVLALFPELHGDPVRRIISGLHAHALAAIYRNSPGLLFEGR
ncbi:hemolysin [Paracoccus limosus]|uniref:Hemolysin n=1 Tax=Paracoccus limosus TaxID=913252 RepID=A0A844GZ03_9RHOB|nr:hemolysin [Paracoccus limosus]